MTDTAQAVVSSAVSAKSGKHAVRHDEQRLYEIGYLLVPTIPESELREHATLIQALVERAGGSIKADELPVFQTLAYTMEKKVAGSNEKYNQGYFGVLRFEIGPEHIASIKENLDTNPEIIRFIILLTTPEASNSLPRPVSPTPSSLSPLPNMEDAFTVSHRVVKQVPKSVGVKSTPKNTFDDDVLADSGSRSRQDSEDDVKNEKTPSAKATEPKKPDLRDEELDKTIDNLVID